MNDCFYFRDPRSTWATCGHSCFSQSGAGDLGHAQIWWQLRHFVLQSGFQKVRWVQAFIIFLVNPGKLSFIGCWVLERGLIGLVSPLEHTDLWIPNFWILELWKLFVSGIIFFYKPRKTEFYWLLTVSWKFVWFSGTTRTCWFMNPQLLDIRTLEMICLRHTLNVVAHSPVPLSVTGKKRG